MNRHWSRRFLLFAPAFFLLNCLAILLTWPGFDRRGEANVVFCFDRHRTMLATDVSGNRLRRGVEFAQRLCDELAGVDVALATFGEVGAIVCPATADHFVAKLMMDELADEEQGSERSHPAELFDALGRSAFAQGSTVIVFTDGCWDADEPAAIANVAQKKQLTVVLVGIGAPAVASKAANSTSVVPLDAERLLRLRERIGGYYVPAETNDVDLAAIATSKIKPRLERTRWEDRRVPEFAVLFSALAAFLCGLLAQVRIIG